MSGFRLLLKYFLISIFLCSFVLFQPGCSDQSEEDISVFNGQSRECLSCHETEFDISHQFNCLDCHRSDDDNDDFPEEHKKVVAFPAHSDRAAEICGSCHKTETEMVFNNDHYRLSGHIDSVRGAFGADISADQSPLTSFSSHSTPENPLQLAEDLLARRCLRCHVYYSGDNFSSIAHGLGCAACHLSFQDGKLSSHKFNAKPDDSSCLSCHYGNHVGYDYYGRFEHDYNEEYRTPYLLKQTQARPFGVEYRQLEADVHQQAGMVCIDCHGRENIMASTDRPACEQCHQYNAHENSDSESLTIEREQVIFNSSATGKKIAVPQMKHAAHSRYDNRFSCQTCHAQWTYDDSPTHLIRIDHDDFDDFYKLSLDGSSEVLKIIYSHISDDGDLLEPEMSDKFSGTTSIGIWFKGFGERRWEQVHLVENDEGKVTTARPILDLRLSWIDDEEVVHFDNIEPAPGTSRMRPYNPHTIGKAGLFYENRIRGFLTQSDD